MQAATSECEREQHYYVTNLPWGRFKAPQILQFVRAHWGIENNCNRTLDVIWDKDRKVWCRQNYAIRILGLLWLMAYNLMAHLCCRYLRQQADHAAARCRWRKWGDLLLLVLSGSGEQTHLTFSLSLFVKEAVLCRTHVNQLLTDSWSSLLQAVH